MNRPPPQRVLVTGSSGCIGRLVVNALRDAGHRVRGLDRHPHPDLDDQVVADMHHPEAVRSAVEGVDQVVHLAAHPHKADFVETLVPANVVGLYHVATAAVEAGVRRLILASSIQVIGPTGNATTPIGVDFAAPTNEYALTKLWGEQIGRMLAARHPLEVLAVRLGWLPRNAIESQAIHRRPDQQSIYLARSDAEEFFRLAVSAPRFDTPDRYACVYAVSCSTSDPPVVDLAPGRSLLNYQPRARWPQEAPTE